MSDSNLRTSHGTLSRQESGGSGEDDNNNNDDNDDDDDVADTDIASLEQELKSATLEVTSVGIGQKYLA
jgi:hypothetical protein